MKRNKLKRNETVDMNRKERMETIYMAKIKYLKEIEGYSFREISRKLRKPLYFVFRRYNRKNMPKKIKKIIRR